MRYCFLILFFVPINLIAQENHDFYFSKELINSSDYEILNLFSNDLKSFDEPNLAQENRNSKIFRFTYLRAFDNSVIITIDSLTIRLKSSIDRDSSRCNIS